MIYDLFTGFENKVNGYNIYVRDTQEDAIDLMIIRGCIPSLASGLYRLGDTIQINNKCYELTEIFNMESYPAKSPPGTGSGQLAARIRSKE